MELRQLTYVIAVAEESSFTRGAARVHVAQPAVSQQIAQLERELGEKLFDRSDRRVRLTPAGQTFLPYARSAVAATLDGRDAVASLRGTLTGRLAIGTIQSPPESAVALLGDFRQLHPAVDIALRVGHPDELTAGVLAGTLDAAVIGHTGQRLPGALASRTLHTEPLVIAVAADHPLAKRRSATLDALNGTPIVTLTRGSGLRTVLEHAFARAGITPDIRAETDDVTLIADLVRHGLGVALLPESVAARARQPLVGIPLRRPTLNRRVILVWHRTRTTVTARAFLTFARPAGTRDAA